MSLATRTRKANSQGGKRFVDSKELDQLWRHVGKITGDNVATSSRGCRIGKERNKRPIPPASAPAASESTYSGPWRCRASGTNILVGGVKGGANNVTNLAENDIVFFGPYMARITLDNDLNAILSDGETLTFDTSSLTPGRAHMLYMKTVVHHTAAETPYLTPKLIGTLEAYEYNTSVVDNDFGYSAWYTLGQPGGNYAMDVSNIHKAPLCWFVLSSAGAVASIEQIQYGAINKPYIASALRYERSSAGGGTLHYYARKSEPFGIGVLSITIPESSNNLFVYADPDSRTISLSQISGGYLVGFITTGVDGELKQLWENQFWGRKF